MRVSLAGICSTDREITRGYMGFSGTPGHEFVGVVESVGDEADSQWIGRRVVGEINASCGVCSLCRMGLITHCELRSVLGIANRDGTHAEKTLLPVANLHEVPQSLTDTQAVFVEPLAAAFEPFAQSLRVEQGTPTVVIGDGKLGLLQARTLAMAGADVTLVGKHPRKLRVAQSWGLKTATPEGLSRERVPLVAECTGSPSGLKQALATVRPRGTLILKSTYAGEPPVNLAPIVVDEITVLGSRCGPFPEAIDALVRGLVDVSELVDAAYPLENGVEAYAHAASPGVLKVLLRP